MQKWVGVLDLSGSDGSRVGALTQLLRDWHVGIHLQALPVPQDDTPHFADEWQARDYARVRDVAVDMVYDGSTGVCVTLPCDAQNETGLGTALLSWV